MSFLTSSAAMVIASFVSGGDNPTLTRNMVSVLRDQTEPTITSSGAPRMIDLKSYANPAHVDL
ncbi:MAG: hypothetical protein AAGL92_01065 [Pseudomonadota bacterium]